MSLNCREIDQILSELNLKSSQFQKIKAINYNSFSLLFYKPHEPIKILVALDKHLRIHRDTSNKDYLKESHNLVEYIRSHLIGGRVIDCRQLNSNRIIKVEIKKEKIFFLYIRLWGGFPNIIITDTENRILHLHRKSSKKDELPGSFFKVPSGRKPEDDYSLKEYKTETYNEFIEKWYNKKIEAEKLNDDISKVDILKKRKIKSLNAELKSLIKKLESYEKADLYKLYGELIISNMHILNTGMDSITLNDYNGENVIIPLEKGLNPYENSQKYFKKYKKSITGTDIVKKRISDIKNELISIETISDLQLPSVKVIRKENKPAKGLIYISKGWEILVGRNAKENDYLLRHKVKGNDMWFHVRDYPGGYVFIKSRKGQTIPLDILKDAALLALYYSKGKSNGKGDIYYTHVKHLKRVKKGKLGQVIPTMNKNLYVTLDKERLNNLKG